MRLIQCATLLASLFVFSFREGSSFHLITIVKSGSPFVGKKIAWCKAPSIQNGRNRIHLMAAPSESEEEDDKELTPERVAEMIEVSFVNGVMQLAQGYVDVLKLFIAAVIAGYSLELSPGTLLETVAACPDQSANRPLMDEEVQLRTTWIQVIYLVLDYVKYQDKTLEDLCDPNAKDGLEETIQTTYGDAIPILVEAKENGESFEAEKIFQKCESVLPDSATNNPLEKAILSQSLRVIWLALTVLEEEAICIEDKKPQKPQPPIPGAFH